MTDGQYQLLVVDDEPDVRELIRDYFSGNGFRVVEAENATAMRSAIETTVPDVVLLDVGLPGEDGLSLARYLRERHDVGIIMVSGAGHTLDRIIGLEVGADDYVTKPFDPRELHARIKSVLRRYQHNAVTAQPEANSGETAKGNGKLRVGDYTLDLNSRQLLDNARTEVPITAMEFDLLQVFAERPNRAMSRDQLLTLTQGRDWDPYDRSIDIRIARLRKKIEPDPDKPQVIKTIRGIGYMFIPPQL